MRQYHGLDNLRVLITGRPTLTKLAECLLADLRDCRCMIYGNLGDDDRVVLAELRLQADTLLYERFEQRIDLRGAGPILRDDCVPLTFRLAGERFAISGRCSALPHVCGRDLYLSSYSGRIGDIARQSFQIPLKQLL
ncbi:hypothetical protein [Methylomonas koyamae]|uniref:hypothetical protein n=1 Tax=Methylomonas koyamae TaxID=702114 RepID=UPI002872E5C2|nr:hypothetical protein [Methylomonas koyamae]WNB75220.1 hypothetical protein RI210_18340 [Methylomonas koyamae]